MLFSFKVALVFVCFEGSSAYLGGFLCVRVCELTDELKEVEIKGGGIASLLCAWRLV